MIISLNGRLYHILDFQKSILLMHPSKARSKSMESEKNYHINMQLEENLASSIICQYSSSTQQGLPFSLSSLESKSDTKTFTTRLKLHAEHKKFEIPPASKVFMQTQSSKITWEDFHNETNKDQHRTISYINFYHGYALWKWLFIK